MTNRFKGLEPIDKLPEEQWMEFPDIVQETGIKTIPKKKKCKKIEENDRMGKTRDLFKKIRDTKMGSIKDRNGLDLTEAEDLKRWQEYTELYKKRSSQPR